jgi:hypothetical protein
MRQLERDKKLEDEATYLYWIANLGRALPLVANSISGQWRRRNVSAGRWR